MGKRIMIVDDSRMVALQLQNLLEGTDYEIAAYCRNGEEAIAQYGEIQPDVVTMDIIMPGLDGLETAQAILEDHPEAKIVMVSSLAYEDTFEEAKSIGAKGFIDKPFEKEQLLDALEKALA
ncbi:MAG: response regulator [Oscillospiraceae bacterium]|nr:response regulator [Oscillospiraceae bacterium]